MVKNPISAPRCLGSAAMVRKVWLAAYLLGKQLLRLSGTVDLVLAIVGIAVIIALGVTKDGTKEPLGVWCGSTEIFLTQTEAHQSAKAFEEALTRSDESID